MCSKIDMKMENDEDDVDKGEDGLGMTCVRGRLVWAGLLPPFPPIHTMHQPYHMFNTLTHTKRSAPNISHQWTPYNIILILQYTIQHHAIVYLRFYQSCTKYT